MILCYLRADNLPGIVEEVVMHAARSRVLQEVSYAGWRPEMWIMSPQC